MHDMHSTVIFSEKGFVIICESCKDKLDLKSQVRLNAQVEALEAGWGVNTPKGDICLKCREQELIDAAAN